MSRTQMTPTATRSRLARSTVAKATIGLMLLGLCAPQAHAKRKYSLTSTVTEEGSWHVNFSCVKVEKAALADNDASTVVVIETTASIDEIDAWIGLDQLSYDAAATREYGADWYTEGNGGRSQFLVFKGEPQPSPAVGTSVEIPLEIFAPEGSITQVFMTDDATETSDEPVLGALVNLDDGNSANANVNVAGGTTNEVIHSCSTVSAPVGMGAIAGLMALGLVRRRRES